MSDDVSFLSQIVRDSMELQAQEALSKNNEQESNVMEPLQVLTNLLSKKFEQDYSEAMHPLNPFTVLNIWLIEWIGSCTTDSFLAQKTLNYFNEALQLSFSSF